MMDVDSPPAQARLRLVWGGGAHGIGRGEPLDLAWSAAVLAGGRSSRFGRDKARHPYRGRPLMAWVLEGFSGASERFILSDQPYPEFGPPVYPDPLPGGDTLSGLHSALHHARFDWVAVAACDQPFLTPEYWGRLLSHVGPGVRAVIAASGGLTEPLGALYHRSLEAEVRGRLERGQLKLQSLLQDIPAVRLSADELREKFGAHLFVNANRLEDLP